MTLPTFIEILLMYALTFGAMNKLPFEGLSNFTDRLFRCSYCTGFHTGWMAWLLIHAPQWSEVQLLSPLLFVSQLMVWSLIGASGCYIIDGMVRFVELSSESLAGDGGFVGDEE
jgi:hypothetical protein